jgi:hypothetical protein
MYSTYRWSSQLADRPSVVYFITLSFFLLTLKGTPKAFSRPHSAITWYYYYYYFLHFAWESTFCKKGLCRHKNECSKTLAYIYTYFTYRWSFTTCRSTVSGLLHCTFLLPLDSQSKCQSFFSTSFGYYHLVLLRLLLLPALCLGKHIHLVRETLQRHKNELLFHNAILLQKFKLLLLLLFKRKMKFFFLQCYNLVYVLAKLHMKNYTILYNTFWYILI